MASGPAQINTNYLMPTPPDEDTWVDDWAQWVENNLPLFYVEGLDPKSSHNKGSWVEYEWDFSVGIYAIRNPLTLQNTVYEWLRANALHLSTYYVKEALARLKTKRLIPLDEFDPYDPKNPYVNCLDGLWYPNQMYLDPHDPDIKCLNQIPCHMLYSPSINPNPVMRDQENFKILMQLEAAMPCWMSMRKFYPKEMDIIERYTQMVLFQDIRHKMQLYIVGGSNTGKSTAIHVLTEICASIASYQPMSEIGEKWGLMPLIGKKVNFDLDSGMGRINNVGLGRLKAIIGDPGKKIAAPIIYQGSRNVVFAPFFITAANQLQRLPENVNREAWGKRSLVMVMDHTFQDDETFEEQILKEKDALFTYLCLKPYHPISRKEFGGFSEFAKRNLRIWDVWADPVRKIIMECFARSVDIHSVYAVEDVEKFVIEIMEDRDVDPPANIARQIRTTFKRMGAKECKRTIDGNKLKCLLGVSLVDDHVPDGINFIFPVEMPPEVKKSKPKVKAPPANQTKIIVPVPVAPPPIDFGTGVLSWEKNRNDPIFRLMRDYTIEDPNSPIEFNDVWEPLNVKGFTKSDIRQYVQDMIACGFVEWREATDTQISGYYYKGKL